MKTFKQELIKRYSTFRTSELMEDDIKIIKKLDNILKKAIESENFIEFDNTVKIISNIINIDKEIIKIISNKFISSHNREIFIQMVSKI